jgi:hypothetical protein
MKCYRSFENGPSKSGRGDWIEPATPCAQAENHAFSGVFLHLPICR